MAGRAERLRADEQRVAVAVERRASGAWRTLPDVSPLRHSRPRDREWKWTSPVAERRGERLDVQPADHQHAAVRDVLDDARDEAVRSPGACRVEPASRSTGPGRATVMPRPPRARRGPAAPPRPSPP